METATTSRVALGGDDQGGGGHQGGEEGPLMRDAAQARLRQPLGDADRGVGDTVARVAQLALGGLAGGVDSLARGLAGGPGAVAGGADRLAGGVMRRAQRVLAVMRLVRGHHAQDSLAA